MKLEVLIAIKSQGKKDINAILSSMNIDSFARIAVYHYNGSKEEQIDFKGHLVHIYYIAEGTKVAAYNALLKLTDADVALFADPTTKYAPGYSNIIESAFDASPRCDGALFGASKEGKRVGVREVRKHSFSALCMKTNVLRERGISFIDLDDGAYDEGVINVFRHECVAWPSRCIGKGTQILTKDEPLICDEANMAFYDSHHIGTMWPCASLIRHTKQDKKKRLSLRAHINEARKGHRADLFWGYEGENKPIKENPFPFVISLISMLGLAVQLVLSLLIVFTEVQYIPIWVSLIFLVLFVVIYAFASPKTHNAKAIRLTGIAAGIASFAGALTTYLLMNVSWAMSVYGAFICLAVVLGVMYCFSLAHIGRLNLVR